LRSIIGPVTTACVGAQHVLNIEDLKHSDAPKLYTMMRDQHVGRGGVHSPFSDRLMRVTIWSHERSSRAG